jgi:hypothetical protein
LKQSLLKYGFSLWLSACLLAGLSAWSGEAFAQTRKIDKVLETLKKKKEKKKKNKPARKPKGNRGGADVDEAFEPPMERRRPSVGKPLPNPFKRSRAVKRPKKNRDGRKAITAEEPLMDRRSPSVGKPLPNPFKSNKAVRSPQGGSDGSSVTTVVEPLMLIKRPEAGKPLPKNDQHYQPELNGKKTLFLKKREAQKQKKIFQGTKRVRKSDISQPGTHYSERTGGAGKDAEGPTYTGNRKVKKKDISEPGKGQQKSQRAIGRHQQEQGTGFMGFLRKKKRDIRQPGTHHEDRPIGLSRQYANSNEASQHSGNRKVKKNSIQKPGTHYSERTGGAGKDAEGPTYAGNRKVKKSSIHKPGTHYSERKMSRQDKKNLEASNHAGKLRVKKKHLKEPGTLHSERKAALAKKYSSYEATNFQGHLRAMSKRQRSRFYEKQSRKVHQYEGNIRLRFNNKENMHPSHVARRAKRMKSAEQVDRYRSFSRWWNRLWSKGQPKAVKDKPAKPRYDKKENEIWENSREW